MAEKLNVGAFAGVTGPGGDSQCGGCVQTELCVTGEMATRT